jgi:hypothetical protein
MTITTKTHPHDGIRAFTEAANATISRYKKPTADLTLELRALANERMSDLGSSNITIPLDKGMKVYYDAGARHTIILTPDYS